MRPNRPRVVDARKEAERMRRTFQDEDPKKAERMPFTWPEELQLVGHCLGVVYSSDKWKRDPEFEDYKHIAEAPQYLLVPDRFLIDWETGDPLDVVGPWVPLPRLMPRHFATLAKFLGVQMRLYDQMDDDGDGKLGTGADSLIEFRVSRAFLGGARVPEGNDEELAPLGLEPGRAFLFVYTTNQAGVHCIITGEELDVEKDGIVG